MFVAIAMFPALVISHVVVICMTAVLHKSILDTESATCFSDDSRAR